MQARQDKRTWSSLLCKTDVEQDVEQVSFKTVFSDLQWGVYELAWREEKAWALPGLTLFKQGEEEGFKSALFPPLADNAFYYWRLMWQD